MDMLDQLDLSLFGLWEAEPDAMTGDLNIDILENTRTPFPASARLTADVTAAADRVLLELKSAESGNGAEELRLLLTEMTREMSAQFVVFRALRSNAETLAMTGDDAQQKLARSDLKAATDAMSLIVRTLEKVDSLQRQLARDRVAEAERLADESGYEEALHDVQALIEQRAQELLVRWQREMGAGAGEPGGAPGTGTPAPDSG